MGSAAGFVREDGECGGMFFFRCISDRRIKYVLQEDESDGNE